MKKRKKKRKEKKKKKKKRKRGKKKRGDGVSLPDEAWPRDLELRERRLEEDNGHELSQFD